MAIAFALTSEMIEAMEPKERTAMKRVSLSFGSAIASWEEEQVAPDIEFSNQTGFYMESVGRVVSLFDVVNYYTSSLSLHRDNQWNNTAQYTRLAAVQTEAYQTLLRIQSGKIAQGEKFGTAKGSLGVTFLRELAEALLFAELS